MLHCGLCGLSLFFSQYSSRSSVSPICLSAATTLSFLIRSGFTFILSPPFPFQPLLLTPVLFLPHSITVSSSSSLIHPGVLHLYTLSFLIHNLSSPSFCPLCPLGAVWSLFEGQCFGHLCECLSNLPRLCHSTCLCVGFKGTHTGKRTPGCPHAKSSKPLNFAMCL